MSFTDASRLDQICTRVDKTLWDDIQLIMPTDESKKLLTRHLNRKTSLIAMFIEINNSTEAGLSLPEDRFALMIQNFAREICIAVIAYAVYISKYEAEL
jgi:hypothetical protein